MRSRIVPKRERDVVIDALRRAASETRETLCNVDSRSEHSHRVALESLSATQDQLATELSDPSVDLWIWEGRGDKRKRSEST